MRKTSTRIQPKPLEGTPTQGAVAPQIFGDPESINIYDEARFLAIAASKNPAIREALQKKEPILSTANKVTGTIIETAQKDPTVGKVLPELANYYTRIHDNFKKSLEGTTLRWSQADRQKAEQVVNGIQKLLSDYPALGILHPAEYPPSIQNRHWTNFYIDTINIVKNALGVEGQLTEDEVTELVARVLTTIHGEAETGSNTRKKNPLHKLAPYITTTPTQSYAIPAAAVISEAAEKAQTFGVKAVIQAIKSAEEKTNTAIQKWTNAMLETLKKDENDPNKLDRLRDKIEQKLRNIEQQYGIAVPDLLSMDEDTKRSYYLRMLEHTVQTLIGQTEASRLFLSPYTQSGNEITVTPRETASPETFQPAQAAFQHEKSTAAMGGVPTLPSTRKEFLRTAQQSTTPEETYNKEMESLMENHWLIFGLMGGFIARSIATEMLRQELENLTAQGEQAEGKISVGLIRGAGPGQVTVRKTLRQMEDEEGNIQGNMIHTYGSIGLPFGKQPREGGIGIQPSALVGINTIQMKTTNEQGQQVTLTVPGGSTGISNAVIIGGHLIQFGTTENARESNIIFSANNPQSVETRTIIPIAFEAEELTARNREIEHSVFVPKIKVEKVNDRYRVQATVGQTTAPSITQQEISSILALIKGDPERGIFSIRERLIQKHRRQARDGSITVRIPFSDLALYETLKAIENSRDPQLHAAQLIVRRENFDPNKGEIERNVSLQLTFYIPENDMRMAEEGREEGSLPTSRGTVKRGMFGRSKYREAQFMAQRNREEQRITGRQRAETEESEYEGEGEAPVREETTTARVGPPEEITTPASRMVYVTIEISIKGLMEAIDWQAIETREGEQANATNEVKKLIQKLYEQAKYSMRNAQPIDTAAEEQIFEKTDITQEALPSAVQEATKYIHYQIIRKIRLGLNKHNIPNGFASQIQMEYAQQLDRARNNPVEFELIAEQSALSPIHIEGTTYTARPQVIKMNDGSYSLKLNVMGTARSTPIEVEFEGIDPNNELVVITNTYRGISEQNKKSIQRNKESVENEEIITSGYSGTLLASYDLNPTTAPGVPQVRELRTPENANSVRFAPDAHLTSGASGLPAGIITTIQPSGQSGAAAAPTIAATQGEAQTAEAGPEVPAAFDPNALLGADTFEDILSTIETRENEGETIEEADDARAESGVVTEAPTITETPAPTEERNTTQTEKDLKDYKVRIYIFTDGGTSMHAAQKDTGVAVSVYYVIEKEDGTKEIKGVYIAHYLGNHENLSNNVAELYGVTTGLTIARAVIEDAMQKGYINEPSEALIRVMCDSQNALKWVLGLQRAETRSIPFFVKNAAQLFRFKKDEETKLATIEGIYQNEGTTTQMERLIGKSNRGSLQVRRNPNQRTTIEIIDPGQAEQDVLQIENEMENKTIFRPNHNHANFGGVVALESPNLTVVPTPTPENQVPPIEPLNLENVLQQLLGQTIEAPAAAPAEPESPAPAAQRSLLEKAIGKAIINPRKSNEPRASIENWLAINNTLSQPPQAQQRNKEIRRVTKTIKRLVGAERAIHRKEFSGSVRSFIREATGEDTASYISEVTQVILPNNLIDENTSQGRYIYNPPQVGQERTQQQNANQRTISIDRPFVSFHGRRDASLEEMEECFELGRKIAKNGAVLVVGGAIGADYAAMLGALSEGGKVIVVHHRDFAFGEYGYCKYTTRSLLEIFNKVEGSDEGSYGDFYEDFYQENNFIRQIVDHIKQNDPTINSLPNRTQGKIVQAVVNKIAAIMTLVTIAPHHPALKKMGIDFPETAEVIPATMRILTKRNNRWTATVAPFLRDAFMVSITDLTIQGPTRDDFSGTAEAALFATLVEGEMDENIRDKAVMTMEEVIQMSDEELKNMIDTLNNQRRRNLQRFREQIRLFEIDSF